MLVARKVMHMENYITLRHIDPMCKLVLATSCLVGAAYATEVFVALYSGNPYEIFTFTNRALGPYAWAYWTMITCNVISPQIFWSKKARTSIPILFTLSIVINIGMWFERFVIVVPSLTHEYEPWMWTSYRPTWVDYALLQPGPWGRFRGTAARRSGGSPPAS